MERKKLLAVDDHPVVLEGVRVVLEGDGYEVLKATTAEGAIEIAEANDDIVLFVIDLTLETDADGLELAKTLRERRPGVPVVIYTMHEEMWNIAALVNADVEGVVLKGEDVNELIEGVRIVGKGARYRSPEFNDRYDSAKKAKGILSQTDLEILRLVSDGMPTGEIARKINLTDKSVEYHRSNILRKLGSKNMTEAIRNAVKLGIITCMAAFVSFVTHAQDNVPVPVDLGLSVQWGDRNLGASAPHEAGGYFAFGETDVKEYYDWASYTLCEDGDMFSQDYIGEDSICGTEYDAATYSLGPDWRLPTLEEMAEFLESCTWEAIPDEVMGYTRFTSPTGAYIDIPLAGQMSLGRVVALNKEGSIWTGSFTTEAGEEDGFVYRLNGPLVFGFNDKLAPNIVEGTAQLGLQIRPVYVGDAGVSALETSEKAIDAIYTIDGRRLTKATAPGLYIIDGRKTLIR